MADRIDEAIEVLNRIHRADPTVLSTLIDFRVPCNEALAGDPTVQVGEVEGGYRVGLLGIINGLFGADKVRGWGFIAANYDENHVLQKFVRMVIRDA